jgi:hypothetical protein
MCKRLMSVGQKREKKKEKRSIAKVNARSKSLVTPPTKK